ncbi:MAG: hypothetical protein M3405_12275 [Acidobacteriota bacterium]|jgi:hypothetical protein|nr:hypothetical protein [Acidobacteriota bacterium]
MNQETLSRKILREQIDKEILLYFQNPDKYPQDIYNQLLTRWSDDSVYNEKHRFDQ